jgi:hypothetical protein
MNAAADNLAGIVQKPFTAPAAAGTNTPRRSRANTWASRIARWAWRMPLGRPVVPDE